MSISDMLIKTGRTGLLTYSHCLAMYGTLGAAETVQGMVMKPVIVQTSMIVNKHNPLVDHPPTGYSSLFFVFASNSVSTFGKRE